MHERRTIGMRIVSTVLLAAALLASPVGLRAQSIADVLEALRVGGGWVRIPVADGKASLRTVALPSAGRVLDGCIEIWPGHSGTWTLDIEDTFGNGRISAEARPADDIPFTYTTGALAQLTVDIEWSEPRDTTLMVWIGLRSPRRERDPCKPVYPSTGSG